MSDRNDMLDGFMLGVVVAAFAVIALLWAAEAGFEDCAGYVYEGMNDD